MSGRGRTGTTSGGGGGGGAVSSVAGKTGAVSLVVADVAGAAPLASPALTGTPTAPTAAGGTSTTQLATCAFVQAALPAVPVSSVAGLTGAISASGLKSALAIDAGTDIVSGTLPIARLGDGTITAAKLANMATATVRGRASAGTGVGEDLTMAQLKTLLAQLCDIVVYEGTWAGRPAASGNSGKQIRVTDYGNSVWRSDGTYWRPLNGMALLYQYCGSLANPLATLAGNGTAQQFVLSAGTNKIPQGMPFPGCRIDIRARMRRTANGGGGSVPALVSFGTANTTADSSINGASILSSTTGDWRVEGELLFRTTATESGLSFGSSNSTATSMFGADLTLDTAAADTYINFRAGSSFLTGDSLALYWYSIAIVG